MAASILSNFYKICNRSHCKWMILDKIVHIRVSSSCISRNLHAGTGLQSESYDVVIVGGGIVGLATARELIQRHPHLKFCVLEKEKHLAQHQSGNNSGVIHAGIYYTPGSLKAKLCVEGLKLTYRYCDTNGIPYKKCGKLIVAVTPDEVPRLQTLYERGLQNGVEDLRIVDAAGIQEIEPNCRGIQAIHSPHTGIIDFAEVAKSFSRNFTTLGGHVRTDFEVKDFHLTTEGQPGAGLKHPITVVGTREKGRSESVQCSHVLTCGGLHADRLAEISGCSREPRIVPFRGDYLQLKPEKSHLVRGNIYPVPNPDLPFLGVHFTPRVDGTVWLGPNAVLAMKREGYNMFDFNMRDFNDALSFRGLRKLAYRNIGHGASEIYRGFNMAAQVKLLRRFIPSLSVDDVIRGPSGVRAQAVDLDGNLVDDFIFDSGVGALGSRLLHVRNAPSPAATSSLAIARVIADKAGTKFKL